MSKRYRVTISDQRIIPTLGKGPVRNPVSISENLYNTLMALGFDVKIVGNQAISKIEKVEEPKVEKVEETPAVETEPEEVQEPAGEEDAPEETEVDEVNEEVYEEEVVEEDAPEETEVDEVNEEVSEEEVVVEEEVQEEAAEEVTDEEDEELTKDYTKAELKDLGKDDLKRILDKRKIKYLYKNTVSELENLILKGQK
jgi:hypothetical protein